MKSANKPKSKNPASFVKRGSETIDSVDETTCSICSLPASIPKVFNSASKRVLFTY
jgi:hypothetical protein